MHGRIESFRFQSKVLADNPLGDPSERDVLVYLPPDYDAGQRFPTVTLLPGFAATHRSILGYDPWKPNTAELFDRLIAEGRSKPALLVLPDCMTRWGGSQFMDSPATGRYQTYLAEEVLTEVDQRFRTIPKREGRAVAGRSSGGFGALRLGMDRPELFSVLGSHAGDAAFEISLRPMFINAAIAFHRAGGVATFAKEITERGPRGAADFDGIFVLAAAAAYAPEPDAPFPHVVLPFDPATLELDNSIWQRWLAHDPVVRAPEAKAALGPMSLIFLDAGDRDEHGLQFAARLLKKAFSALNARVHHEEYEGGHRGTSYRYEVSLPTMIESLAGD